MGKFLGLVNYWMKKIKCLFNKPDGLTTIVHNFSYIKKMNDFLKYAVSENRKLSVKQDLSFENEKICYLNITRIFKTTTKYNW